MSKIKLKVKQKKENSLSKGGQSSIFKEGFRKIFIVSLSGSQDILHTHTYTKNRVPKGLCLLLMLFNF